MAQPKKNTWIKDIGLFSLRACASGILRTYHFGNFEDVAHTLPAGYFLLASEKVRWLGRLPEHWQFQAAASGSD